MERRNDLGGKILAGVLITVIAGLLMTSFTSTRNEAYLARGEAQAATIVSARHSECLKNIEKHLEKMDEKIDYLVGRMK